MSWCALFYDYINSSIFKSVSLFLSSFSFSLLSLLCFFVCHIFVFCLSPHTGSEKRPQMRRRPFSKVQIYFTSSLVLLMFGGVAGSDRNLDRRNFESDPEDAHVGVDIRGLRKVCGAGCSFDGTLSHFFLVSPFLTKQSYRCLGTRLPLTGHTSRCTRARSRRCWDTTARYDSMSIISVSSVLTSYSQGKTTTMSCLTGGIRPPFRVPT